MDTEARECQSSCLVGEGDILETVETKEVGHLAYEPTWEARSEPRGGPMGSHGFGAEGTTVEPVRLR